MLGLVFIFDLLMDVVLLGNQKEMIADFFKWLLAGRTDIHHGVNLGSNPRC